jgi:glycosyltransferase involved in cell wall biosynthesis
MSAPNQRVKRILYSQFTDILFAYSVAVKNDWEHRRKHNPFIWLISYHKKISVCKNGVYLPRIKFNQTELLSKNNKNKRFIFVSRLAAWKGLSKVINIIEAKEFEKTNLLIVSPDDPMSYLADVDQEVKKRISSVIGKSVSQIQFYRNDLHIYPATYGPTNRYIESISINVLEMACFGVKSFVTKNGVETWPDLAKLGMIFEVDWSDLPSAIRTILENDAPAGVSEIAKARELIDIQNHLNQIYCAAGFDKLN